MQTMSSHPGSLSRLAKALPPPDALGVPGDPERQSRAALALLVREALSAEFPAEAIPSEARLCPNCDTPCDSRRSPYCSEACRDLSAFVRQLRAGLSSGAILDPDRQSALGQNLWRVLGGGYTRRTHLLTRKAIDKAIEKAGGRCAGCGARAVTVDHIGSG